MVVFSHSNFAKSLTFLSGLGLGYVMANPDLERVWEVFPCFNQKDYAYLSFYNVTKENSQVFERIIKCLTRYLQTQNGYGYTRVVRLPEADGIIRYIGFSTWYSDDLMKRGLDSSFSQKMISKLPIENNFGATTYKVVVDDSEYTPQV